MKYLKDKYYIYKELKFLEIELISPPLDGTILEGVTRQSILDLARQGVSFEMNFLKGIIYFKSFLN